MLIISIIVDILLHHYSLCQPLQSFPPPLSVVEADAHNPNLYAGPVLTAHFVDQKPVVCIALTAFCWCHLDFAVATNIAKLTASKASADRRLRRHLPCLRANAIPLGFERRRQGSQRQPSPGENSRQRHLPSGSVLLP